MIRKLVIALMGSLLASLCCLAIADVPGVARVGFVWPTNSFDAAPYEREMRQRLHALGWEEGRNLVLEQRWVEGRAERLPALMSDLVARKVDVIVTVSTPAAIAAKNATDTVPIVAVGIGDPIGSGLARSLARPGGNLTGVSYGFSEGFAGKWLELLRECVPRLETVALVYNPDSAWSVQQRKDLEAIVPSLGIKIFLVEVRNPESVKKGLPQLNRHAQGVIVVGDPVTVHARVAIAAFANRQRLPTVASMLEFVDAGAMLSYGVDNTAVFRRMAEYVNKILRGAKPGELPIEQPLQLNLSVNAKTAALIGVSIPPRLLEQADKVIR